MYFFSFWQGYVTINGDASICRLKPLLGKGSQTNSLPTGLNRISWKRQAYSFGFNGIQRPYRLG